MRFRDLTGVMVVENFKAKLITDNLRASYENTQMMSRGVSRMALATFLWRDDFSGRAAAFGLIEARRRGVDVTVVVDAVGILRDRPHQMFAAMVREGVKVLLYRPVTVNLLKSFHRLHEKCFYIELPDGRVQVILGGRNRSDLYGLSSEMFDVDVRLTFGQEQGKEYYSRQFDSILNMPSTVPFQIPKSYDDTAHAIKIEQMRQSAELLQYFFQTELSRTTDHSELDVSWGIFARNQENKPGLTKLTEDLIARARSSVTIANAYFIPTRGFHKLLKKKLSQNVSILVYTNSENSTPHTNIPHLMEREVSDLLPKGLGMMLRRPGELHAKALTVDSSFIVVGSANMDPRSEVYDTQNAFILHSPETAKQFDDYMTWKTIQGDYEFLPKYKGIRPVDFCRRLLLAPFKFGF